MARACAVRGTPPTAKGQFRWYTGGSGKSRLSLQVAARVLEEVLEDFPDGVWLVELAAIADTKLVLPRMAQVLGVKEEASRPLLDTLKDYLQDKQVLLLLDNFEHVIEAAPQVAQLLTACPRLKVLVTSRSPLRIQGEQVYPVSPLALPPHTGRGHRPPVDQLMQYEAVQLFVDRALAVKPDFQLTAGNAQAVVEICIRLDGLPLAIELAAGRTKVLTPRALLTRLSSRLKTLIGGMRDKAARQQTLRGAIDWSYNLLSEGEKQFFCRMAAFQGGSTLEALEAVCNFDGELQLGALDGVQALVDSSLVQLREGRREEPRFWMLETIHEYAREKLDESGEAEVMRGSTHSTSCGWQKRQNHTCGAATSSLIGSTPWRMSMTISEPPSGGQGN